MQLSDLIGIPFSKDGESPQEGFDCWGLVRFVYKEFYGIELPDFNHSNIHYLNGKKVHKIIEEEQNDEKLWEKLNEPEEPCILAIKNHPLYINHTGIYVGRGKFLQSLEKVGVILSDIHDKYWSQKIVGFYKWKEISS